MLSIVISLLVALATFVGARLTFDLLSGLLLAPIAGIVVYVLLARRVRKRAEAVAKEVETHLKAQRFERAISSLESLRPLYRWQPLLGSSTEAQIGMIQYAYQRDFEGARPYLQKAHRWLWQAWLMLAAGHFKKKRYDEMESTFERAAQANKKAGMLWATYAWCQWKRGLSDAAMQVLGRGLQALPDDERLKGQHLALQNGKKLKMNGYGAEWMTLHLETPTGMAAAQGPQRPQGYTPPPGAFGKGGFRRMRPR